MFWILIFFIIKILKQYNCNNLVRCTPKSSIFIESAPWADFVIELTCLLVGPSVRDLSKFLLPEDKKYFGHCSSTVFLLQWHIRRPMLWKCISFDISLFSALFKRVGVSCLRDFHQHDLLGQSVMKSSCLVYSLLLVKFWLSTRSKELTNNFFAKKTYLKKLSLSKTFFTKTLVTKKNGH